MTKYLRDPFSSISHGVGAIVSVFFLVIMLVKIYNVSFNGVALAISISIFAVSSALLYTASSVYHGVKASDKILFILRKLDHAMIFVLIAGSYAPFCIMILPRNLGIPLLTVVWIIAIIGILFKIFWFKCPRLLSTLMYIAMGWLGIFVIKPIYSVLPTAALVLFAIGGIAYTIGGIIYAIKKPSFKYLDFHDIFHIFTLIGTIFHFLVVYIYIIA
ncbi:MAG: PAQR family membrane homeostasis protein TrhA [Filifactoraceae bacterium]